jgi:hypothetical protein
MTLVGAHSTPPRLNGWPATASSHLSAPECRLDPHRRRSRCSRCDWCRVRVPGDREANAVDGVQQWATSPTAVHVATCNDPDAGTPQVHEASTMLGRNVPIHVGLVAMPAKERFVHEERDRPLSGSGRGRRPRRQGSPGAGLDRAAGVRYRCRGTKSSIGLPEGSSSRICDPPGPVMMSLRKRTPAARSRVTSAARSSTTR